MTKLFSTLEYLLSAFAGVVARAVVELVVEPVETQSRHRVAAGADGSSLQNLTYDYDSVGNINTITDSLSGAQTQTFTYDELDRLLSSSVTGGTDGLYTEGYSYDSATGNLASKNNVNYTAYDANHKHAVTSLSNGNAYGYDQNGNMTSRHVLEGTEFKDYTLNYDAENRLVSVSGNATASFAYDGDGKQIKATVNGVTAVYVGQHYEVKSSVVSKYHSSDQAF